jgi:hypothetical protein
MTFNSNNGYQTLSSNDLHLLPSHMFFSLILNFHSLVSNFHYPHFPASQNNNPTIHNNNICYTKPQTQQTSTFRSCDSFFMNYIFQWNLLNLRITSFLMFIWTVICVYWFIIIKGKINKNLGKKNILIIINIIGRNIALYM